MTRTAPSTVFWVTATVLTHLVVTIVHGRSHAQAQVPLSPWANAFVALVILAGPLAGLGVIRWSQRLGAWLIAVTMAASLVFGLLNHFALSGPDNVGQVDVRWRPIFTVTAVLLAVTEALGFAVAIRLAGKGSRS